MREAHVDVPVALLEAEEIARVADELLAEGDPDVALALLEEALSLVGPGPDVP